MTVKLPPRGLSKRCEHKSCKKLDCLTRCVLKRDVKNRFIIVLGRDTKLHPSRQRLNLLREDRPYAGKLLVRISAVSLVQEGRLTSRHQPTMVELSGHRQVHKLLGLEAPAFQAST